MPAMPSSANAASVIAGLPALAARPSTAGKETDAAVEDGGPDQFSTHFQRLLGMHSDIGLTPEMLTTPDDSGQPGEAPAPGLAALLPFIEALGLTRPSADAAATDRPSATPETAAILAAGEAGNTLVATSATVPMAIAAPAAPAISAATPAAQGQARGIPFNPTVQAPPADAQNTTRPVPGDIVAAQNAPADDASAGREFSAQLVAAIGASKEQAQIPGNTSAAVQQVIASHSPAPSTAAAHADPVVARPVGSSGWAEEIGNHVVWLANRSESRAELVLTPPQMGRVEVSLAVKGDQAVASFVSNNPAVREALEAALPRLREVLADAGIQLGQAQVSAENARQWAQQDKHRDNSASDPARTNPEDAAISRVSSGSLSASPGLKGGRGLVDVFA